MLLFTRKRSYIKSQKKKIPAHTNFLLPCSSEYNPIETSGVLNAEYYRSNPSLQPCRSGIRYHFTRQVAVVFCKQLCFGQRQHEDACKAGWNVQKQCFRSRRNRESLCTVASIKGHTPVADTTFYGRLDTPILTNPIRIPICRNFSNSRVCNRPAPLGRAFCAALLFFG